MNFDLKSSKERFKEFKKNYYAKKKDREDPKKDQHRKLINEEEPIDRKVLFQQYVQWIKPFRLSFLLLFLLACVGEVLTTIQPLFMQHIVDNILLNKSISKDDRIHQLFQIGMFIVVLLISAQVLSVIRSYLTNVLNA